MGSLFDRLQDRKPATRRVVLPLSDEAVQSVAKLERVASQQRIWGTEEAKEKAEADLVEARTVLKASSVVVRVQALCAEDWDALQRANPPTAEQIEEARKEFGPTASVPWNTDTFVAAGWEACQLPDEGDDRLSYEQCQTLLKRFSQGEKGMLLRAIQEVNETTVSADALGE